jgi:hypothetical protein
VSLALRRGSRGPGSDNQIDLEANQLGGQRRKSLRPTLSMSGLDHNILAFHVAELAESLPESLMPGGKSGDGSTREGPDTWNLPRRLRLGGERRKRETESATITASPITRMSTSIGMAGVLLDHLIRPQQQRRESEPDQPHGHLD